MLWDETTRYEICYNDSEDFSQTSQSVSKATTERIRPGITFKFKFLVFFGGWFSVTACMGKLAGEGSSKPTTQKKRWNRDEGTHREGLPLECAQKNFSWLTQERVCIQNAQARGMRGYIVSKTYGPHARNSSGKKMMIVYYYA